MLVEETIEKLNVLGLDVSKLTEAIQAEDEVSLDVPELYTKDQLDQFGSNRFTEGKTAMTEILAKSYAEKLELEVPDSDRKNLDKVIELYGNKVQSSASKNSEEWQQEKQSLQAKLQAEQDAKTKLENDFKTKLFNIEVTAEANKLIPDNTTIAKDDINTLFFNRHSIEIDEQGRKVVKQGDKILKDNLENPISLEQAIKDFTAPYLSKGQGVAGKDETSGSSARFKDYNKYLEYCENNGLRWDSPEVMGEHLELK